MTHVMALAAGSELVGDYRIERVLGAGGFGITYLAEEMALARKVTIKEYFPADFAARDRGSRAVPRSDACSGDYDWGLERFMGEAQTLARFDHPNIVRVYRYFRANNTGYMALHFEEGRSFKAWLAALGRAPRQSELDEILGPALDALEAVHAADYLHRDIAPDNIIIRTDGSPVLIDFGSARGDIARHSRTVSALIKPGYSPYEQYAETASRQGPWSDLYALAATLYFAVTGKRPPDAPSRVVKEEMAPASDAAIGGFRRGFLKAIDRALAIKIEQRPRSVKEFRRELLAAEPPRRTWFGEKSQVANETVDEQPSPAPADSPTVVLTAPLPQPPVIIPAVAAAPASRFAPSPPAPAPLAPSAPAPRSVAAPTAVDPVVSNVPSSQTVRAVARAASLADALAEVKAQRKDVGTEVAGYLDRLDKLEGLDGLPRTKDVKAELARNRKAARRDVAARYVRGGQAILRMPVRLGSRLASRASSAIRDVVPALRTAFEPMRTAWSAVGQGKAVVIEPPHKGSDGVARENVKPKAGKKPPPRKGAAAADVPSQPSSKMLRFLDWRRVPRLEILRPIAVPFRWGWHNWALPLGLLALVGGGVAVVEASRSDVALISSFIPTSSTGPIVKEFTADRQGVRALGFTDDEDWFITAGADRSIKVWNTGWGSLVRTVTLDKGPATALAVSGREALTGHGDGTIVRWDLATGRQIASYRNGNEEVRAVAFMKDRKRVLSASKDATVSVWEAGKSDKPVTTLDDHNGDITSVAVSSDGRWIVSGGTDATARLYNGTNLSLRRSYRGHRRPVTALAISPNGSLMASGAEDGVIRVWSTRTGRRLRTVRGHTAAITALSFSDDGRQIVSSGGDGMLKFWTAARGQLIKKFGPVTSAITSFAIGHDGHRIVSGSADGTVRVWDAKFEPVKPNTR